jgi:predicted dehydrogenase
MMKMGIVGTGMMLNFHCSAFNQLPNISVHGCTREYYGTKGEQKIQKKSLEKVAEKLGIKAYPNFEEMVNDKELTFLVITSINSHHYDHIIQALKKGKHILVEKPVITDIRQLNEIKEQARAKNLLVFPGHNFVYRPAVLTAKEIIDEGKLGTIVYASFISCFRSGEVHSHGWRASEELASGGALMDSGHHQVYQSLYLLGKPKLIHGFTSNQILKHMEGEDFAMINAYYEDGFIANIGQGHSSDFGDLISGIKIVGEKGNILITDTCYHNGEKISETTDYATSFYHQAKYFVNFLDQQLRPISSLIDVRNSLEIIYAAYKSAKQNKVILL